MRWGWEVSHGDLSASSLCERRVTVTSGGLHRFSAFQHFQWFFNSFIPLRPDCRAGKRSQCCHCTQLRDCRRSRGCKCCRRGGSGLPHIYPLRTRQPERSPASRAAKNQCREQNPERTLPPAINAPGFDGRESSRQPKGQNQHLEQFNLKLII